MARNTFFPHYRQITHLHLSKSTEVHKVIGFLCRIGSPF